LLLLLRFEKRKQIKHIFKDMGSPISLFFSKKVGHIILVFPDDVSFIPISY